MTMAADDVIKAAASVARDAAEGRLSPAALEEQAVAECRELFGTVTGPGDALWELQVEVARDMLAQTGIPADELSEWLAIARQHTYPNGSVWFRDFTPAAPRPPVLSVSPVVAMRAARRLLTGVDHRQRAGVECRVRHSRIAGAAKPAGNTAVWPKYFVGNAAPNGSHHRTSTQAKAESTTTTIPKTCCSQTKTRTTKCGRSDPRVPRHRAGRRVSGAESSRY